MVQVFWSKDVGDLDTKVLQLLVSKKKLCRIFALELSTHLKEVHKRYFLFKPIPFINVFLERKLDLDLIVLKVNGSLLKA